MSRFRLWLSATLILALSFSLAAADYSWLDGLSLVAYEVDGPQSLHRARLAIQENGGAIGVMSSQGVILAWLDGIPDDALEGRGGIRSVHSQPVTLEELGFAVQKQPGDLERFVNFFNEAVTGEYGRAQNRREKEPPIGAPGGDALAQEPLELEVHLRNLESKGYPRELLAELGVLDAGKDANNDTMSGTVLVSQFIVESDGSGSDPNNHDWSLAEVQDIVNARIAGLLWWAGTARSKGNCWVAFLLEFYDPSDPRVQSPLEPVFSSEVSSVMQQIMAAFGYGGSAYTANTSFNTDRRLATGTDRAYSMITTWGSGRAWAYRFGPYTWLPYPTAAPEVTAHETGHIFGGCDEYEEACGNCPVPGCSANGVGNPNCVTCPNSVPCVMNANDYTICNYTDDHIGWIFNPCSPPNLPAPTLSSISPGSGFAGETVTVTITGTNILQAAQLDLGPGVSVWETDYTGGTQIIADITINTIATPGLRDAELTNPNLGNTSLASAFEVLATPSHYFSPTGGNVFPYTTPANAASAIADALAAAGPGDTIYMESTTLTHLNLLITRDVTFSGGWDAGFGAQDLLAKTVIDPTPNLRSVANVGFENIRFINGNGRIEVLPVEGEYGGAVAVFGGDLTLNNCEFENNAAMDPQDVGLGGAAYVEGGNVVISGSSFTNNQAYQGAALYLENCSVSISNSSFDGNALQLGGSVGDEGAAIRAVNCSSFGVYGSSFDGNTGAKRGGAIYFSACSGLDFQGGTIANHSVVEQGGALWITGGTGAIQGVNFSNNSSNNGGGAIYSENGSLLTFEDNHFSGNSSTLGASIQHVGGEAFVNHNLFTGNSASITANSIYVSGLGAGGVIGNVTDANLGSGTDFLLVAGGIEVKNNILMNTPGVGITCSGALDVDYNLVFNSAGAAYSGCGPGPNALSGDPLFVGGGDYHLALHSPGIDAGDPARSDDDGSAGDLGLYGAHAIAMAQPAPVQNLQSQLQGQDTILNWDANGEGDLASYAVYADPNSGFVPSLANYLGSVPAGTQQYNLGNLSEALYVRVNAIDNDGYAGGYSNEFEAAAATSTPPPASFEWALYGAIPNPFNPRTQISFELAEAGRAELLIFDVTGRVVRTLSSELRTAGRHTVEWDATDDAGRAVSSGIYYYELRAGGFRATQKMLLLK